MQDLTASQARIPTKILNRVIHRGEPVRITHRSAGTVVVVSEEQYKALCEWEDLMDTREAQEALKAFRKNRQSTIPYDRIRDEAGLP